MLGDWVEIQLLRWNCLSCAVILPADDMADVPWEQFLLMIVSEAWNDCFRLLSRSEGSCCHRSGCQPVLGIPRRQTIVRQLASLLKYYAKWLSMGCLVRIAVLWASVCIVHSSLSLSLCGKMVYRCRGVSSFYSRFLAGDTTSSFPPSKARGIIRSCRLASPLKHAKIATDHAF